MRAEWSLECVVTRAPNRKLIENLQEIKLGSQQVKKVIRLLQQLDLVDLDEDFSKVS